MSRCGRRAYDRDRRAAGRGFAPTTRAGDVAPHGCRPVRPSDPDARSAFRAASRGGHRDGRPRALHRRLPPSVHDRWLRPEVCDGTPPTRTSASARRLNPIRRIRRGPIGRDLPQPCQTPGRRGREAARRSDPEGSQLSLRTSRSKVSSSWRQMSSVSSKLSPVTPASRLTSICIRTWASLTVSRT